LSSLGAGGKAVVTATALPLEFGRSGSRDAD
jgi:hypothetical protein